MNSVPEYWLLTMAASAIALVVVTLRIRLVRTLVIGFFTAIPAAMLLMLSVWGYIFWWPIQWLVRSSFLAGALTLLLNRLLGFVGSFGQNLLALDQRETFARVIWPEEKFPFLYRPVPSDIRRPLYEDGTLIGGKPITWLVDRHLTSQAVTSAVAVALTAAFVVFLPPVIYALANQALPVLKVIAYGVLDDKPVLEQWPGEEPLRVSAFLWWKVVLGNLWSAFINFFLNSSYLIFAWSVLAVGVLFLTFCVCINRWRAEKGAPYQLKTKDADVRWAYRAEARNVLNHTYNQQVLLAGDYLKKVPLFALGTATGFVRARGDLSAPVTGQPVALDGESLFQHLLVLGGTGEGKTTAVLKPLIAMIMSMKHFGMFICDAKGVLWRDAVAVAVQGRRRDDIRVIGTGPGQFGVDPLATLNPSQVAGVLRSVLRQVGGKSDNNFWPDMAVMVIRHALTIGHAYARTEAGLAEKENGLSPYSLWWAYQALLDDKMMADGVAAVVQQSNAYLRAGKEQESADLVTTDFNASASYLGVTWKQMANSTRTGIIANVTQLLDGFSGAPELRDRFASGRTEGTISIREALNGKILVTALSSVEDGLPARLINILLKTALYREARVREGRWKAQTPPRSPQEAPCAVVMDEVQEIVTSDPESGLSDATFWNVARSSGLAGIFATQTIAALVQAMGQEATDNFLQQARSKIFFRSEDQKTVDYACWCAGSFERNRVFEENQRESIEFRNILDGWDPFLPVDENESIKGGPRIFMRSALALLSPEAQRARDIQYAQTYATDMRFVGMLPATLAIGENAYFLNQQVLLQGVSMLQQAVWRAEDLEREYKTQANESHHALTPADVFGMGRWHAFAHIQRAGALRQDIILVSHRYD